MAIGTESFNIHSKQRIPFFLLTNILGGPGMNSRLNLSLREKHGYVYGVDANFSSYIDTGVFAIYFATDPRNLKKSISLIKKEIEILKKKPLGQIQLHKAKQQLKGQMAMSEENNNAVMLMMAKSMLDLDKVPDINKLFDTIDEISAEELAILANEALDWEKMCSLTYHGTE
jgi:predicted Zn-dependent peptidase